MRRQSSNLNNRSGGLHERVLDNANADVCTNPPRVVQHKTQNIRPSQITAVDLFAGAGGFSLSAHNAGIGVLAAVELNKHACSTYQSNLIERMGLETHLYNEDINELTPEKMIAEIPALANGCDLIVGGPPCQGFSSHRFKDKGVDDPRNELLIRYFEFVEALQPTVFLVENVPGLLWKRHKNYLVRFRETAENAGYKIFEPVVLNASDFGVPQRRRRVFILGMKSDCNLQICWPPKGSHCKPGSGSTGETREWLLASDVFIKPLSKDDPNAIHMNHSPEMVERFKNTKRDRADSGFVLPCHQNHDGHKDCYGRIDMSMPGPTMTTACINPSKGRFVHPTKHHGITLRHAARFQTFPDDYVFDGGLISGGVQVGNAVPIRMGEQLLRTIAQSLTR
jgi:DNA (cytosine-5)-methyltransferase 1